MPDDRNGDVPAGQIPVSPDNPCPFLRALVACGYVGGHVVPLQELCRRIEAASGEHGFEKTVVGIKTYLVAVGANGPAHLIKSATSGAVLDELRNGPLDKHGAGSRILDATAHVHEDEIDRLATFGQVLLHHGRGISSQGRDETIVILNHAEKDHRKIKYCYLLVQSSRNICGVKHAE